MARLSVVEGVVSPIAASEMMTNDHIFPQNCHILSNIN